MPWYRDGRWRVHGLPDVEGALAIARIKRWLAATPDVDRVSTDGDWEHRIARVTGTTFCVGAGLDAEDAPSTEPWCWHEPRSVDGWRSTR